MTEEQFSEISWRKPKYSTINILRVPHKGGVLEVGSVPSTDPLKGSTAFGQHCYSDNVALMNEFYTHPWTAGALPFSEQDKRRITFREPTTCESISAAAFEFEKRAKKEMVDWSGLELGRIVKTREGVFVNPPRDKQGRITPEHTIRHFLENLDKAKQVNGIYLFDNDFGFAPYETFKRAVKKSESASVSGFRGNEEFAEGVQCWEEFAEGGLARVLEGTDGCRAEKLGKMASFYPYRIFVVGFDPVRPKEAIVTLEPAKDMGYGGEALGIYGCWEDKDKGIDDHYAFGVLVPNEHVERNKPIED